MSRSITFEDFEQHIITCPDCIAELDGDGDVHPVRTCPAGTALYVVSWEESSRLARDEAAAMVLISSVFGRHA
jgi:hypothetical protein